MNKNYIPTINISSLIKNNFETQSAYKKIKEIEKACVNIGFFQVTGHGLNLKEIKKICGIGNKFFNLSDSKKKKLYTLNTLLLCITYIFIGFSSWMMIPIRSNAETVINENSPKDARSLLAYYNLEQYPDTYLFYGPMFSDAYAGQDAEQPYKDDKPKYERDETLNKYIIVNDWKNGKINSNSSHRGFFPRMWSSDNAENYMKYYGFLDFEIKREYRQNDQLNQIVTNFKDEINNNEVVAIDYSAHEEMANKIFHEIRESAFEKFDLSCMHIYHSLGKVKAGEICLFVFASSKHRKPVREALEYLVEEIKAKVPIFGKELFINETHQWKVNQ